VIAPSVVVHGRVPASGVRSGSQPSAFRLHGR
jgi:hypothetical protein